MTKKDEAVGIREVYQLVQASQKEVLLAVGQVREFAEKLNENFTNLESGRLSMLEKQVANVQGRLMYVPILISAAISVFGIFVSLMFFAK